jgi:hypothetical protein
MKIKLHRSDERIVVTNKVENLLKKTSVQHHKIDPESAVVTPEATIDTPMRDNAYRVLSRLL